MTQRTTRGFSVGYLGAAVVFAIGMLGTTLPTPLYGLYREELHFSEFMVTVVFAVYAFGVIAVLLLLGDFSDRIGRRPVLFIGLGLSVASAVCFLSEGGLPLLFAGRLLSGFAAGLFSGAATATVMDLAPAGREARAGLAATAANMGGLGCGPLLAGLLAEYAPLPLRLPFAAALGLALVGMVLTWFLPEPVEHRTRRPGLRPRGLRVPPQVRGIFAPAALAAFAGFALLGLCTAVSPTFVGTTLGEPNLAVAGAVVFSVFLASTVGQSQMGRVGAPRALPGGSLVLVAGLVLVGVSLFVESLALLVVGVICGGLGQGLAFRAAITLIGAAAPQESRGGTISAFFVVAYIGISLPVIGIGALTLVLNLRVVGLVFTGCVAVLAACVGLYELRELRGRRSSATASDG
ncbi:MFS transporter [Streptomyces sp. NPDC058653]|uniref:MFS transporter n=1 Tax=Streptomyces sp. NPDC058653 TaxID=3346576 RepID=UPI003661084D